MTRSAAAGRSVLLVVHFLTSLDGTILVVPAVHLLASVECTVPHLMMTSVHGTVLASYPMMTSVHSTVLVAHLMMTTVCGTIGTIHVTTVLNLVGGTVVFTRLMADNTVLVMTTSHAASRGFPRRRIALIHELHTKDMEKLTRYGTSLEERIV